MLQIRGLKEQATPKERLNEDHDQAVSEIRRTIDNKPKLNLGADGALDSLSGQVSVKSGLQSHKSSKSLTKSVISRILNASAKSKFSKTSKKSK